MCVDLTGDDTTYYGTSKGGGAAHANSFIDCSRKNREWKKIEEKKYNKQGVVVCVCVCVCMHWTREEWVASSIKTTTTKERQTKRILLLYTPPINQSINKTLTFCVCVRSCGERRRSEERNKTYILPHKDNNQQTNQTNNLGGVDAITKK